MFELPKSFVDEYRVRPVPFGWGGVGEVAFYRTYSRKDNPKAPGIMETWADVCERCINGMYQFQETWCKANGVNWNIEKATLSAREAFDLMFNFKWSPPGRGLWMCGTDFTMKRGTVEALQNCAFCSSEYIAQERGDFFRWLMEMSMLGVGVGFDTRGAGKLTVQRPLLTSVMVYVVPDTRQGWAHSVELLIDSYFNATATVDFDYSHIRPRGAVIHGFGGVASGPAPLVELHEAIRQVLDDCAGRQLNSRTIVDLCNLIGKCVVAGNVRRSAELALGSPRDLEFINLKNYGLHPERADYGWVSNNSILAEVGMDYAESAERTYANGEPGYFWIENAHQYGRMDGLLNYDDVNVMGCNPCVTGDTWIAVADGRGRARMSDLAADGKDVDVFTVKDGQIVIRAMRNPRKTGTSTPILKITFSDGSHIRVTPNHKFIMINGSEKQAADLEFNDAVQAMSVYSYKKVGLPKTSGANYDAEGSYRMVQFKNSRKSEHRLIFRHHTGIEMNGTDFHLHHKNFDGRDNRLDNLAYMSAEDHATLHRERMMGEHNPALRCMTDEWRAKLAASSVGNKNNNANPINNDDLRSAIMGFIRSLGYHPSVPQYEAFAKANSLPQTFTKYRKSYFGGNVTECLRKLTIECGIPEKARHAKQSRKTDLPTFQRNGETFVVRHCEACGREFEIQFTRREQAVCSNGCGQRLFYQQHDSNPRRESILRSHAQKKNEKRTRQVKIFNDLIVELGRNPTRKEWTAHCKSQGVSAEISRVSSPFQSYADLTATAQSTNHRVVAVEDAGFEDVYTGTVDDTHTYFSIGCERQGEKHTTMGYVLSKNCGEIGLHHREMCTLCEIYLPHCKSKREFLRAIKYAYLYGKSTTLVSDLISDPQTRAVMKRNRRIGLSVTGVTQFLAKHGAETLADWLDHGYHVSGYYDRLYSQWLGVHESIRRTSVKPSGTVSIVSGVTPGAHFNVAGRHHIRRMIIDDSSPLLHALTAAGYDMEPSVYTPHSMVVEFPVDAGPGVRSEDEVTPDEQLQVVSLLQRHWSDNAVSATVKFDRKTTTPQDIKRMLDTYQHELKGISFLPLSEHGYAQAPYESITADEYARMAGNLKPLKIDTIGGKDKRVELFCDGDACLVPTVAA